MNLILIAVISLGAIALVSAAILYAASKKFAVYEDPRIAQVSEVLPQANCGGCGYPGCSGFADACVKAGSLDGKFCPGMVGVLILVHEDVTEPVPTVLVPMCTTGRRVVRLPLLFTVVRQVVVLVVWAVATVWPLVSSMPFI